MPGRGSRVKWEKVGDGAEFFEEDEDEFDEDDEERIERDSSDEELEDEWVGVNGRKKGEVPYEDRWEIDHEELTRSKVGHDLCIKYWD